MPDSKVAIEKCSSYSPDALDKAIGRALFYFGDFKNFIKPGERVLIKPNLLSARDPEEGVTTHPEFIRAVIRRIKPVTKNIVIGDSPGGYGKNTEDVYQKSGVRRVADEEGVGLVRFEKSKKIGRYPVATAVLEADRVISLPKFKTHDVMLITGAVKNMYGIAPGIFKAQQHSIAPRAKDLAPILVDIFSIRKPDLTIVDAVLSMDGNGPSRGRLRKTGFIICSTDAVAIDSVLMKIAGAKPLDLLTNMEAHKRALGATDLERIEILGEPIDKVKVPGFKFSELGFLNKIPNQLLWLIKLLINFKVRIDTEKCLRCRLCEEACPVQAIMIEKENCSVDNSRCMLCLCCREICPHKAVEVDRSFLAKKIWG